MGAASSIEQRPESLDADASGRSAVLRLRGLQIHGPGERLIVSNFDLDIHAGEAVGIVGESGSGKSLTARALVGLPPAGIQVAGSVALAGQAPCALGSRELARLRGSTISLILQDPFTMLDPLMRCGEQISESLRRQNKRRKRALRPEVIMRLAEVGIDDPGVADRYPFQLSGGMRQRVAIAAALALDPTILIADEPTTGLDVTIQRKVLDLISELRRSRNMAVLLITHDLGVAFSTCDRVNVLYAGSMIEAGPAREMADRPLHPYTLGLLMSEPRIDRRTATLHSLPGSVPRPDDVRGMCVFVPRCSYAADRCRQEAPALRQIDSDRRTACVRISEIEESLRAARRATTAPELAPHASGDDLLSVRSLEKRYAHRMRGALTEVVALGGVSIRIGLGETVGLVGESGSGKTTLARSIVGLELPDAGTIEAAGHRFTRLGELSKGAQQQVRRAVQIVFQDPYSTLNPALSVGSTLREIIRHHETHDGDPAQTARDLLETVGLPASYEHRKPAALSGGERQRVAIARALAVRPRLLVLDEAVSALDVSVQAQILELLQNLKAEFALSYLFITHDLAVVRQIADRVYVMHHGNIVESGTAADVIDRPSAPYTRLLRKSVLKSTETEGGLGANDAATD